MRELNGSLFFIAQKAMCKSYASPFFRQDYFNAKLHHMTFYSNLQDYHKAKE